MTILEGTIDYPPSCDTDEKREWFRRAVMEIRAAAQEPSSPSPFPCPICSRSFGYFATLQRHMENVH